jgi:hypothetical protein
MSNHQKDEFVGDIFCIRMFWGDHGKNSPKTWSIPEGTICPEMLIPKPVEFLTAVTRESLTIWSRLRDHRKSGRVFQLFGIQLRGRIPSEPPQNLIFLRTSNLPRNAVFSKTGRRSKFFTPKPSTIGGCVDDCQKPGRVLFVFGVQLWVEFHVEQSQCHFSLMLLQIEAKRS